MANPIHQNFETPDLDITSGGGGGSGHTCTIPDDIRNSLSEIQNTLSGMAVLSSSFIPQYPPAARPAPLHYGGPAYMQPQQVAFLPQPAPSPLAQQALLQPIQTELAKHHDTLTSLSKEVTSLRSGITILSRKASTSICSGPVILSAMLLAITLIAIAAIILSVLGYLDILPQILSLVETKSNLIWVIISASISAVISLVGVLGIAAYANKQISPLPPAASSAPKRGVPNNNRS